MFCRKISITRNTRPTASTSVTATSVIEILMKREVSKGIGTSCPPGKSAAVRPSARAPPAAVCSALPLGDSCTPMPVEGLPFRRAAVA
jgi:hypothetical protein